MTHAPWSWPPQPVPPDLSMLMGRLLERSEVIVEHLDSIDQRLREGDERMDEICERLASLETKKADPLPGWERVIKSALPILIGLAALLSTGSIDAALKVMAALGGGGK